MPGEQSTLAEQAFERIYELILSGALPLGSEVNEVSLSQRFDISRGTVREAVRRLQGLRLVTREPYMRACVVSLSQKDVVEIFQLREVVEGMACRLATKAMSDEALDRLMADLERARRNGARSADIPGEPFDLHIRVAVACGNERARQLLTEELYHLLRLYRRRSGDLPGRREQAFDEHWQIVRAMHNRDPDLAESLMRSHIARATESLLATLAAEREAEGASAPPRPLRRRRRTRVVAASPAGAGLAAEQPHESAAFAKESERAKAR
ncbi:GntR family transcriptional regulator [Salinarimonas rosea]|uniref:GntR family transcriptional regulator n=1 Tax=Salinarimonas rosea TaxID=552063 RepID=UPI0009FCDDAE|nr:GntR family transcriptional regulator [Salinarimonas rosea]